MAQGAAIPSCAVGGHMDRRPIALESAEEFGNRDAGWIDGPAALHLRNQPSTRELRLPFASAAWQRDPFAPALARRSTGVVDHGVPAASAALTNMPLHLCFLKVCLIRTKGAHRSSRE